MFGCPPIGPYDSVYTAPYHPSVHNFGNVGFGGWCHAKIAPAFTFAIDSTAYKGKCLRRELAHMIATRHSNRLPAVDLGCGVGILTKELEDAGLTVAGIDSSPEMSSEARRRTTNAQIMNMNVIDFPRSRRLDEPFVAVACMLFHEVPAPWHSILINEYKESRCKELWIADIDPAYNPSPHMLSGEPYLKSYLSSFEDTIVSSCAETQSWEWKKGRVKIWVLTF